MGKQTFRYQSLLENISDWALQSTKQDMLTMVAVVEKAKAYLQAMEEISEQEMNTLQSYLFRDLATFSQHLSEDAGNSLWWQNTKYEIWQTISHMSDRGRLEFFEMQVDVAHHGTYTAGELVAIGELICNTCGHSYQITGVQRIESCIKCSRDTFSRKASSV